MKFVEQIWRLRVPNKLARFKVSILKICGENIHQSARVGSITVRGPRLVVGESWLGDFGFYVGSTNTSVVIEDNVDIGPNVKFFTGSHHVGGHERRAGRGVGKDIKVGAGVWIGANSTILGGVRIGSGSIIAAGSNVINDVPEDTLVAGNPARIKRKLI